MISYAPKAKQVSDRSDVFVTELSREQLDESLQSLADLVFIALSHATSDTRRDHLFVRPSARLSLVLSQN